QLTVNQLVVGSIPTAGAKKIPYYQILRGFLAAEVQVLSIARRFNEPDWRFSAKHKASCRQ
ncbi:hypothetical protein, partial [Ruegeria arenilitoris]|uniref:hypothetical protein n=1 Tax=Ruegeria arenilitoris TaxID=1173585 RepID=UPI001C2C64AB